MRGKLLVVPAILALFGCSNNSDLRAQLAQMQKENVATKAKLNQMDAKIDPKDAIALKREETNKSIEELKKVIASLRQQVEALNEDKAAKDESLNQVQQAFELLADYVAKLPTDSAVDSKIEDAMDALLTHVEGLLWIQQLNLSQKIEDLATKTSENEAEIREWLQATIKNVVDMADSNDRFRALVDGRFKDLSDRIEKADKDLLPKIKEELKTAMKDVLDSIRKDIQGRMDALNDLLIKLPAEIAGKVRRLVLGF